MYGVLLFRHRHVLSHLRRIEIIQDKDLALPALKADGMEGTGKAVIMKRLNQARGEAKATNNKLREQLPTALRRLTSGFEMRCFWSACAVTEPRPHILNAWFESFIRTPQVRDFHMREQSHTHWCARLL